MSLKQKVTIVVILIIATIFLPVMYYGISSLRTENEKLVKQQIKDYNNIFLNSYTQRISSRISSAKLFADFASILYDTYKNSNEATIQNAISDKLNSLYLAQNADGSIYSIALLFEPNVFPNSSRLNSILSLEGQDGYVVNISYDYDYTKDQNYLSALPENWNRNMVRNQDYFMSQTFEVKDPITAENVHVLSVSSPIYNQENVIIGVAVVNLDLYALSDFLEEALEEDFILVFDEQAQDGDIKGVLLNEGTGIVILHTDQEKIGNHVDNYNERNLFDKEQMNLDTEGRTSIGNMTYRTFSLDHGLNTGNRIFVLINDEYFSDHLENIKRLLFYVGVIFVITSILASMVISHLINTSLKKLEKTVDNVETTINNKDFNIEYIELEHKSAGDIISETIIWTKTFNQMLQQLMFNLSKKMDGLLDQSSDVVTEIRNTMGTFKTIADKIETLSNDMVTQKIYINSVTEDLSFADKSIDSNVEKITEIKNKSNDLNECISAQPAYANSITVSTNDMKNSMNDIESILKNLMTITKNREEIEESNKEHIQFMDDNVGHLSKSMTSMAEFVSSITEISVQTNMLAMNASIEAAHAGEHGKGFAVVAEEIRKLSYMSSKYAENANESLKDITKRLNITIGEFKLRNEYFIETVKTTNQINKSVESLNEINYSVSTLSDSIKSSGSELNSITKRANIISKDLSVLIENSRKELSTLKTLSSSTMTSVTDLQKLTEEDTSQLEGLHDTIVSVRSTSTNITNLIIKRTDNIKILGEEIRSYNIPDLDKRNDKKLEEDKETLYVSSSTIIQVAKHTIKKYGMGGFEKLVHSLPPEMSSIVQNYKNIDKKSFFTLTEAHIVEKTFSDLFYDGADDAGYKLAREFAKENLVGITKLVLKAMPKSMLISSFISAVNKMFIGYRMEVVKSRKNQTIIQLRNIRNMSNYGEHAIRAMLVSMVELKHNAKGHAATVEQSHSVANGDMYVEYIVNW